MLRSMKAEVLTKAEVRRLRADVRGKKEEG